MSNLDLTAKSRFLTLTNYRVMRSCPWKFFSVLVLAGSLLAANVHSVSAQTNADGEQLFTEALAYQNSGEYPHALKLFEEALRIFRDVQEPSNEVNTLICIAKIQANQKESERAQKTYAEALKIANELHDPVDRAQCQTQSLIGLGTILRDRMQFQDALTHYQQAADIAEKGNVPQGQRVAFAQIGTVYTMAGQYGEALRFYEKAVKIMAEEKAADGGLWLSLAITYGKLGQIEPALHYAQRALTWFETQNQRQRQADALSTLGMIADDQGRACKSYYVRALSMYQQASDIYADLCLPRDLAGALNNIGVTLQHLGDYQQALEKLNEALKRAQKTGAEMLQGKVLTHLGETYFALATAAASDDLKDRQLAQAFAYLMQANQLQQQLDDQANRWLTLSQLGQIYELQGKIPAAQTAYREAIALVEDALTFAANDDVTISLGAQIAATYQRLVGLLAQQGAVAEAFGMSEQARARTFLDHAGNLRPDSQQAMKPRVSVEKSRLLHLTEIRRRLAAERGKSAEQRDQETIASLQAALASAEKDYEAILVEMKRHYPEYASFIRVMPPEIEDIQAKLDDDAALLAYFVTPAATFAFILTHQPALRMFTLNVTEPRLRTFVETLHRQSLYSTDLDQTALQDLYAALIAPLKAALPVKTKTLGIIPHGVLHYLPFAALTDGARYLSDDYALFTLPSASVFPLLQQKRKPHTNKMLVLAASSLADKTVSTVPYTALGADWIARSCGSHVQISTYVSDAIRQDATETRLKASAGEAEFIHFAAHGELNTNSPLLSAILLSPDTENDGRIEVHEIYELNLQHTNLVVLSACQTQPGKQSEGDDMIGLTRAFMSAGAPAVVSTLWKVDDQATAFLMAAFYRNLSWRDTAAALQAAQRQLRQHYPQPYYWAGFVLNGDPR